MAVGYIHSRLCARIKERRKEGKVKKNFPPLTVTKKRGKTFSIGRCVVRPRSTRQIPLLPAWTHSHNRHNYYRIVHTVIRSRCKTRWLTVTRSGREFTSLTLSLPRRYILKPRAQQNLNFWKDLYRLDFTIRLQIHF